MNPIRTFRQNETRRYSIHHNFTLDIGSGWFNLYPRNTSGYIRCDIRPETKPDCITTICRLHFRSESLGQIIACEILEHLHKPELEQAISEIYRVLKPRGRVIITIPNSSNFMSIPQRIIWFIREHTTQKEYHNNSHTHTHIGLIHPLQLTRLLINHNFKIILTKRLMLYDYLIIATK